MAPLGLTEKAIESVAPGVLTLPSGPHRANQQRISQIARIRQVAGLESFLAVQSVFPVQIAKSGGPFS